MWNVRRVLLAALLAIASIPALVPMAAHAQAIPAEPDTERRTRYTISASTGPLAVGFDLYGDGTDYANWIEVYVNGVKLSQAGNWTLTPASGSLSSLPRPIIGATISFAAAQTGTIDIVGARRPRRMSQFQENQPITAHAQNQAYTDLWMTMRERWDRSLLYGPGSHCLPTLARPASPGRHVCRRRCISAADRLQRSLAARRAKASPRKGLGDAVPLTWRDGRPSSKALKPAPCHRQCDDGTMAAT